MEPGLGPGIPFRFNSGFGGGARVSAAGVDASGAGVVGADSEGLSEGDGMATGSGGADPVEVDDFDRDCLRARGAGEPKFASLLEEICRTTIFDFAGVLDEFLDEVAAGVPGEDVGGAMVDDYLMAVMVVMRKGGRVDG